MRTHRKSRPCGLLFFSVFVALCLFAGSLESLFELVELSEETGEESVVGIFFKGVMKQTEAENELLSMLLAEVLVCLGALGEGCQVVMAAKVEVHDFLNFTVHHFGDVEMIRTFFFWGIAITVHNSNLL